MKTKLFALLALTFLFMQPIMAIPDESTLEYRLNGPADFPGLVYSSDENQTVTVQYDRWGHIFAKYDTVLVIRRYGDANIAQYILTLPAGVNDYKDNIKYIIIKSNSNNIKILEHTFENYKNLRAVYAYVDTISLYSKYAFSGCNRLTAIEGRDGQFPPCQSIWPGAFAGCAFSSIDLSNSDSIEIGNGVFANCANLESIVFPSKASGIAGALNKLSVASMFSGCRALKSVTLPNYMRVGYTENMFKDCESLEELKVPDGFSMLRSGFLNGCTSLKKLTIPESVASFDSGILDDCSALDTVIFAGWYLPPHFFKGCPNLHELKLLNGLDSIADYAFSGLKNIQTLQLPKSLHAITGGAFVGSTGIDTVWCASYDFNAFDGALYKGFWNELVYMPPAQTPSRLTLHNLTKHIGPYAFCNNAALDTILLSYDLESIGDSAFAGCTNIKKLYVPNMQTTVGQQAFDGVQKVQFSNLNYPNGWCDYDFLWTLDSIGIFTLQGQGEFFYPSWETHKDAIKYVIWPKDVTLPDGFMQGYNSIQCAVLPMKVEEKPSQAFYNGPQYILYDDAFSVGGYNYKLFSLLEPVNVKLENNMEITPMVDSLLVRWKSPGMEPENLYGYGFRQGEIGDEWSSSQVAPLAFNSEAFHNRLMDSIRAGADINRMRFELEYGSQPCNDGMVLPIDYEPKVYELIVPDIEPGLHWYSLITGCGGGESELDKQVAVYKVDSIATANTTFRVRFYKGGRSAANLISEQQVPFRQAAVAPADPVSTQDYEYFAYWNQDFSYITHDMDIFPIWMNKSSLPEQLQVTKNESQIKQGIVRLTFKWTWPSTPFNSETEWQLLENGEVIASAYAPLHLNPTYGTHTEQVTVDQLGYGEHTLSWRVRTVGENYHDDWSIWVDGDDIQFTFTNSEGVENVSSAETAPKKVLHNGQIVIVRDNKTYTVQGQEIQ